MPQRALCGPVLTNCLEKDEVESLARRLMMERFGLLAQERALNPSVSAAPESLSWQLCGPKPIP